MPRCWSLGTDALAEEVTDVGLRPVRTADEQPQAVLQGLSQDTGWRDLAEAAVALRAGALWVAGNADSTYPTARGPLPGNGAFVEALAVATGLRPLVAGKPEPALHRESLERVGAQRPLVVGDRLDTDVLGAVRGGTDSLLVLTGVVDRAALLAAPRGSRPTYVASDLRGLLQPHPPAEVDGDTAGCGAAEAVLVRRGGPRRGGRGRRGCGRNVRWRGRSRTGSRAETPRRPRPRSRRRLRSPGWAAGPAGAAELLRGPADGDQDPVAGEPPPAEPAARLG